MRQVRLAVSLSILAGLTACASPDPFADGRSAFYNPYAALVIENGPVGPDCPDGVFRDGRCWIDGVGYLTDGRFGRLPNGDIVRLDRNERRWLREQREAIVSRIDVLESLENGTPLPPDSPALPENQSRPVPPPPPPSSGD